MIRRTICLLLIAQLLLAQVVLCHCHPCEASQARHARGASPHIHARHVPFTSHDEHNSDCCHRHHQDSVPDKEDRAGDQVDQDLTGSCHHDDAIEVPDAIARGATTLWPSAWQFHALDLLPIDQVVALTLGCPRGRGAPGLYRSPDSPDRPLYVQFCSLLI